MVVNDIDQRSINILRSQAIAQTVVVYSKQHISGPGVHSVSFWCRILRIVIVQLDIHPDGPARGYDVSDYFLAKVGWKPQPIPPACGSPEDHQPSDRVTSI